MCAGNLTSEPYAPEVISRDKRTLTQRCPTVRVGIPPMKVPVCEHPGKAALYSINLDFKRQLRIDRHGCLERTSPRRVLDMGGELITNISSQGSGPPGMPRNIRVSCVQTETPQQPALYLIGRERISLSWGDPVVSVRSKWLTNNNTRL